MQGGLIWIRFNGPARLSNWICRCDDLEAALDAFARRLWRARYSCSAVI